MSTTLNAAAIAAFASEVKHAYQGVPKLRNTVRVRTGVTGSTYRFPKLGAGIATQRVPQTDIVPMNLAHTNATATLEDWNAAEYTDVFDEAKTNISERAELSASIAKAIGRREDQLIIDALDATATTLTVASSVGATTGLNVDKLRRIRRLLGANGVGEGEKITFAGSYNGQEDLLGETEVGSQDYNSVRALVNGEVNTFMGMTFKWIETRAGEGGLDLTGTDRTNFAYAMSAVGHAVGIDQRMEVNYIPTKTSWLANMLFSAGSIEIDAGGVVEVTTVES